MDSVERWVILPAFLVVSLLLFSMVLVANDLHISLITGHAVAGTAANDTNITNAATGPQVINITLTYDWIQVNLSINDTCRALWNGEIYPIVVDARDPEVSLRVHGSYILLADEDKIRAIDLDQDGQDDVEMRFTRNETPQGILLWVRQLPEKIPGPSCNDFVQNQNETGVDCGGPCKRCWVPGSGPIVPPTAPASPTATCSDGIANQGETGIDCGGPCFPCEPLAPPAQPVPPAIEPESGSDQPKPLLPQSPDAQATDKALGNCADGLQNNGESGVDCGGPCFPCEDPAPAYVEQPLPTDLQDMPSTSKSLWLLGIMGLSVLVMVAVGITYYLETRRTHGVPSARGMPLRQGSPSMQSDEQSLRSWIRNQDLSNPQSVFDALIQQGVPIQQATFVLQSEISAARERQVREYVDSTLREGHRPEQVAHYLLSLGFDQSAIDAAISEHIHQVS